MIFCCTQIKAETIIFTIGNTVSMMGLLITLITLCVFSKLRTVSGRCLMNMVASLFLAKFSFQVSTIVHELLSGELSHSRHSSPPCKHNFCIFCYKICAALHYHIHYCKTNASSNYASTLIRFSNIKIVSQEIIITFSKY